MTGKNILLIMLAAGLILPSLVQAQTRRGFPGMKREAMRQQRMDQNKDTRDMIEDLRIVRMTKELNLTDQQLAKFLPKMREIEAARREFHQKRVGLIKDMEDLLGRKASEKDLQAKLSEMDKLETDFLSKERETRKTLINQLSVEQQARLVVFQENFERDMRELIRGIRQGGAQQPGMGPPPSPGSKTP
jgi:hypothetical protein